MFSDEDDLLEPDTAQICNEVANKIALAQKQVDNEDSSDSDDSDVCSTATNVDTVSTIGTDDGKSLTFEIAPELAARPVEEEPIAPDQIAPALVAPVIAAPAVPQNNFPIVFYVSECGVSKGKSRHGYLFFFANFK